MLRRKMEETLLAWKRDTPKKALLVKGARQVGKTTSIEQFGKAHYKSFIEMNFEKNPAFRQIFAGALDAKTIFLNMSAMGLGPLIEHETLVFFDEVQSCPNARTAIKFLVQDGRFDFVESGSLLGINYREVGSFPVGFETQREMCSLDFEEFLWAKGIGQEVVDVLKDSLSSQLPLSAAVHTAMMRHFREFMIVGGMPAAVNRFLETADVRKVVQEQKDIIDNYRDDVKKYAGSGKIKVREVFDSIPEQLSKKNKRFFFSQLTKEPKLRTYEDSILWLFDAGIASPCYNVSAIAFPLSLNEKRNLFKVYLNDTGLLTAMSFDGIQSEVLNGNIEINEGAIVENALAEAFVKKGMKLHYFDRKKPTSMEIDFVLQNRSKILVLEAKSGSDFEKHDSLDRLIREQNVQNPVVFCIDNIHMKDGILYLPYYLCSFLDL